jgi:selenocysteine lyase/cysteine desulfurase
MAVAALELVLEWEPRRIAAALAQTTAAIAAGAVSLGLEPTAADQRGPHMLGVAIPDGAGGRLAESLAEADCYAAVRSSSLRISPHLHNTPEEVERLLSALGAAIN